MQTTDPIELIVAEALTMARVKFTHESANKKQALDFHLPEFGIDVECKQFSSERTSAQIAGRDVILIQGRKAAECFAALLSRSH